jgi:hypothetical protein
LHEDRVRIALAILKIMLQLLRKRVVTCHGRKSATELRKY